MILLVARLVQRLSHSGETGSAFTYLTEIAPSHRRGMWASTSWLGVAAGTMLATGMGVLLSAILDDAQMAAWGWQVPFAVAALLGLYALYIRRTMTESEVHTAAVTDAAHETGASAPKTQPLGEVMCELGREWKPRVLGLRARRLQPECRSQRRPQQRPQLQSVETQRSVRIRGRKPCIQHPLHQ